MKVRVGLAAILIMLAGANPGRGLSTQSQKPATSFSFVITTTVDGARLTCDTGCTWKELSFSCDGSQSCTARVDQDGIR